VALTCTAAAFVASPAVSHDGHDHPRTPAVRDEIAHAPTAIPDRIVLTWTSNPATTQSVTWRTDTTVQRAIAEIAVAEDGPKFVKKAKSVVAETTPLKSDLGEALYHTAIFEGLSPKTKYVYRVGDGTNYSEWLHFKTASHDAEPFSFIYFGDAQNDIRSMWSRVIREAYGDAPRSAFMLHAGDLINNANSDAEWGEWFQAGGFIHRMVPCIASPGNHEYANLPMGARGRELSRHWRPTFAFPQNGPRGLEETVYYIDYQGTRIISLNSNVQLREQVEWLETVLGNNPCNWTILTFHHPVYSTGKGRDNVELRETWQPVFDKYRVDLVLTGHDHTYGRTGLMTTVDNVPTGANVRSSEAGTVYVVSVSGPKMYDLNEKFRNAMKRVAEDTQLYQVISIDGDSLEFEARTATGRLYDRFTLKKRPGQINELVNDIPNEPENLRVNETKEEPAAVGAGK
jgi:hypothetical protein